MRILGVVVLLCVIAFVCLGFYFQWFHVSTASGPQRSSVEVTVDRDKMRKDLHQAKEDVSDAARKAREKADAAVKDK